MTRKQMIAVGLLALVAGTGSFLVGRSAGQTVSVPATARTRPAGIGPSCNECDVLASCLGLSPREAAAMAAVDPDFSRQADALRSHLSKQRHALAHLLEDPGSSDEVVMQQVERVIAAHDALERRVAAHVLAIRKHLTPPQAKRLMGLAAGSVRSLGRCRAQCASARSGG